MSGHTPTPWRGHDMETATLVGPDHLSIADCNARNRLVAENRANAALIVRAVNSHAALVEALRALTTAAEAHIKTNGETVLRRDGSQVQTIGMIQADHLIVAALAQARAALKQAEES